MCGKHVDGHKQQNAEIQAAKDKQERDKEHGGKKRQLSLRDVTHCTSAILDTTYPACTTLMKAFTAVLLRLVRVGLLYQTVQYGGHRPDKPPSPGGAPGWKVSLTR